MAEKDVGEKKLEDYNDVFADILNVLLFGGEQVVREEDLVSASPLSVYKADGKLHEQERDVAKYWLNSSVRIASYGFENQTGPDSDIPLRVIGYDGADYRSQLLRDKAKKSDPKGGSPDAISGIGSGKPEMKPDLKENSSIKRYPVVTLVLYFGMDHWKKGRSLYDRLEIPDRLKPYVSDYKINIFEIAWLEPEQVELFRSDFKIVADYFVQMRKNKEYQPSAETITHVQEVLQLMTMLTGDDRFEQAVNQEETEEGGVRKMCEAFDKAEARGEARGRKIGEAEGRKIGEAEGEARGRKIGEAEGEARGEARGKEIGKEIGKETMLLQNARSLMKTMQWTAEQTLENLMVSENDRGKYVTILEAK